jgi:uncharacterized protein (DUF58 family)
VLALTFGAAVVVAGYFAGRSEYLAVGGAALVAALFGLAFVRLRRPRLAIGRLFSPPVVAAGDPTRVTLRVRNIGAAPSIALAWNDAVPWYEPHGPNELEPVGVFERVRNLAYEIRPPRRGLYPIGPFVAEYQDPLGMATATLAIGDADRLVVVPAIAALSDGGPALAEGDGAAQLVQRRVTGSNEDLSTREYRPGDALRRVHWRASARHGELMVRQEEHRSHPDARLVVDTRRRGYPDARVDRGVTWAGEYSSDAFEWVVRMAGSLGVHLQSAGFQVAVEETAPPQIASLGEPGRDGGGFLTSLAAVKLLARVPDRPSASAVSDGSGPLFAVLADPEDATVDWLLHRRRPGDVAYAFLVEARGAVRERLSENGWVVVDANLDDEPDDAWRLAAVDRGRFP